MTKSDFLLSVNVDVSCDVLSRWTQLSSSFCRMFNYFSLGKDHWGGGGGRGVRSLKNNSLKGKLNEKKILARQLILKIFILRPKKNSYKEFDDEKKFPRLKNSPPPPP